MADEKTQENPGNDEKVVSFIVKESVAIEFVGALIETLGADQQDPATIVVKRQTAIALLNSLIVNLGSVSEQGGDSYTKSD